MNSANLAGASTPVRLVKVGEIGKDLSDSRYIELEFKPLTDRKMEEINQWLKLEYMNNIRENHRDSDLPEEQKQTELSSGFITAASLHWMTGVGQQMMATPRGLAKIVHSHLADNQGLTVSELTDLLTYYENVDIVNLAIEDINTSDFKKDKLKKLKKQAEALSAKKTKPRKPRKKKKTKQK